MSRSYEIRLTTPGFDKAVSGLTNIGKTAQRIDTLFTKLTAGAAGLDGVTKRFNALADAMERAAKAGAAAGSLLPGGGGGSGGGGGTRKSRQFATGPNQQLAEAMQQLENAKAAGNPLAVRDAARSIRLKERAISLDDRRKGDPEHLSRPGLLELFSDLNDLMRNFRTGNVGAGARTLADLMKNQAGGINMQQMLGAGGLIGGGKAGAGAGATVGGVNLAAMGGVAARFAGPVGAVVAAGSALMVLAKASRDGAEAMRANVVAANEAGASLAQMAGLVGLGLNAGEAASLGASLRAKLSSDPYAMAAGGYAAPGHLSGESNAPLVERALAQLRDLYAKGATAELTRLERVFGMERFDSQIRLSNRMLRDLAEDARVQKRLNPEGRREAINDHAASQKRVDDNWKMLGDRLNDSFGINTIETFFNDAIANGLKALADSPRGTIKFGNPGGNSPQVNATKENTQAMKDLAAVIQGIVGGGQRARGALTPAQRAAAGKGNSWDVARDLRSYRF